MPTLPQADRRRLRHCGALRIATVMLIGLGCRVPDPPIVNNGSRGAIYDTAMEAELKSGQAPALVASAYARYVDTLAEPVAITEWADGRCRWEVFVATNRGRWAEGEAAGDDQRVLESPRYGHALVTLPRQKRGTEPPLSPSRKPLTLIPVVGRRRVETEEVIATAEALPLGEREFLAGVADQVRRSRQCDLFLFVHGFNVSFDAAVIRTAQLALDLPFNGAVVSYCWPSRGGVFRYEEDEPVNRASVAPFAAFLHTLREGVPLETRINIVVHSMGNRIVMEALQQMPESRAGKPFANVVLCAPDVGHVDFRRWAPGVVAQSERVTLYASAGDAALIASKGLHAETRAGDAWEPLVVPGVELVDCGRVDLTILGHNYYGSNVDVLSDLFMVLKENLSASERPHLAVQTTEAGDRYWAFEHSPPAIHWTWHFDE